MNATTERNPAPAADSGEPLERVLARLARVERRLNGLAEKYLEDGS